MMKQLFLSLTLIMLLLAGCATAAQEEPQPFPTEVAAEIQAEVDDLTANELAPGALVWIDAPAYRFEGASGLADLAGDSPMPPDGAFRIGSITKMFTDTVIMQLAEDGVLTLDDPLSRWLPEVAGQLPNGDQITLRHLLAHTSGLATPTLVLEGGESPYYIRRIGEMLLAALPDARVRLMDGQQHVAMDTAPELFAAEVRQFLQ